MAQGETIATARPTAVRIEPAWDDAAAIVRVIRSISELWPIARYAASEEELAATGAGKPSTYVPPWFRSDVALEGAVLVPGAEQILHNDRFVEAARTVFGADAAIRPTTVYVNVMLPSVVPFVPHLDVPAFRGFTRRDHPIWLLKTMLESGLFEAWQVKLATAVSWFYAGPGGAFHYWPDGQEGDEVVLEPPFENVAVLADNERTYHGVGPVGTDRELVRGLTRNSALRRIDGGWQMVEAGELLGTGTDDEVRLTVSWKAEITNPDDATDALTIDHVVDSFRRDLHDRGADVPVPDDPHRDPAWIQALGGAYPPTTP